MLKVAGAALRRRGHNMIIVAPTKKASAVAGRETQSASSSLHQLLHDYGWRWTTNDAGATEWTRLQIGETDPSDGRDLRRSANQNSILAIESSSTKPACSTSKPRAALLDVVERTGAGVAVVGDEHQALPVGHSGAMALFWRRAADQSRAHDDPPLQGSRWADLSLRLRDPDSRGDARGRRRRAHSNRACRPAPTATSKRDEAMVEAWFDATRTWSRPSRWSPRRMPKHKQISEAIQARRIESGAIRLQRTSTSGQAGQAIFVGDVVQTRRNDSVADVQNRQNWIVKKITTEHVILASRSDSSDLRKITPRIRRIAPPPWRTQQRSTASKARRPTAPSSDPASTPPASTSDSPAGKAAQRRRTGGSDRGLREGPS